MHHPDMRKLLASLSRKWRFARTHLPLRERLSLNRGKALGYPKPMPPTRQARKAQDKRQRMNGIF